MEKKYITAQMLLEDSFELAIKIVESGFKPDLIIGVWRGGSPVAIAIQEALEFMGTKSDHIPIRSTSYTGIGERAQVKVQGLEAVANTLEELDTLLIVDDVFDTGFSLDHLISELNKLCKGKMPKIKIATTYFKPDSNQTQRKPDYYLYETEQWLVFPHELLGLSNQEILEEKLGIDSIKQRLLTLRRT